MEDGLNWGMIICVEIILFVAILAVIFYGVYLREVKEIEQWKRKARHECKLSDADMES